MELEQTQRHTHGNQTGHHAAANFVHQLLLLGGQAEHAHLLGLRLVPKEANELLIVCIFKNEEFRKGFLEILRKIFVCGQILCKFGYNMI